MKPTTIYVPVHLPACMMPDGAEPCRAYAELRAELGILRALLSAYVADENRFNQGEGEPYGTISTELGMRARAAVSERDAWLDAASKQATKELLGDLYDNAPTDPHHGGKIWKE